ncbi:MAG: hypothetical protein OEZ06_24235 [Myxococcales bacterium]|nr:hypothetical protein [Myxococcales bacterium]
MSKFNRAKRPSTEPEGLAEFAAGAAVRSLQEPQPPAKPWEGLDPAAKPSKGFNVRLNEYELALLRYVAERDGRSAQKTIKRVLIAALEAKVQG